MYTGDGSEDAVSKDVRERYDCESKLAGLRAMLVGIDVGLAVFTGDKLLLGIDICCNGACCFCGVDWNS